MSPWRASQFLHGKHQLDLYRGPATNACPHIRLPHTRVCFALDMASVTHVLKVRRLAHIWSRPQRIQSAVDNA